MGVAIDLIFLQLGGNKRPFEAVIVVGGFLGLVGDLVIVGAGLNQRCHAGLGLILQSLRLCQTRLGRLKLGFSGLVRLLQAGLCFKRRIVRVLGGGNGLVALRSQVFDVRVQRPKLSWKRFGYFSGKVGSLEFQYANLGRQTICQGVVAWSKCLDALIVGGKLGRERVYQRFLAADFLLNA